MRIAQIAPPWITIPSPCYGETENIIYYLVEELIARGHEVTLLAPGDASTSACHVAFIPTSLISEGVPWHASLKAYYHLHKSLQYVTEHPFDIVHTHLSSSGDMYLFPLSSFLTIPHITTLHSHFPFDKGPEQWIGDADLHFMDWSPWMRFVATSHSTLMHQRLPLTFAGVIHHGIPVENYYLADIPQGDYWIWMGQLTHSKAPHLAIEAARRANVPLILAGTKEPQNREAVNYFHHMIQPYLDGQSIRFIGSPSYAEKIQLLNGARGLLNSTMWEEPLGITMIEAMACGCPIVAFACGSAPEIIVPGKTGLLVNTVEEMITAIQHIEVIDRATVREHARQHFSAHIMVENYLHLYQQMIDSGPSNRVTEPLPLRSSDETAYGALTA